MWAQLWTRNVDKDNNAIQNEPLNYVKPLNRELSARESARVN